MKQGDRSEATGEKQGERIGTQQMGRVQLGATSCGQVEITENDEMTKVGWMV